MESRAATASDAAPEATGERHSRGALSLRAVLPVALLALALALFTAVDTAVFDLVGDNPPPADEVSVSRVLFKDGVIEARVLNPQPEELTIASVTVDGAVVNYSVDGAPEVGRLEGRTISIPYPWIEGEPYEVGITTSTGVQTVHEVPVAVPHEGAQPSGLLGYGLIGLLVGVLPIALGLMWLPSLRRVSDHALHGFMALTVGLLTFLGFEALFEALETQALLPDPIPGVGLIVFGVTLSFVGVGLAAEWLKRREARREPQTDEDADRDTRDEELGATPAGGFALAIAIAIGIGLHNLGEGLAIGSSFAVGELALGSLLIVGFTVHNITEGLGIAVPLADHQRRTSLGKLAVLTLVAGLPAVFGAWIGGYITSTPLAVLFFAIAAGAAAQVIYEVVAYLRRQGADWQSPAIGGGFAAGVLVMFATSLIAG